MKLRRVPFLLLSLIVAATAAAEIRSSDRLGYALQRPTFYAAAHRLIVLADGSHLLLYEGRHEERQPNPVHGLLVRAGTPHDDRSFRLELWIPDEIKPGTYGQIYSVAQSADHGWLAIAGGWHGAADNRGHNGIFILRRDESDNWKLQSWFDVRGATIGELEFGPGDTVLTGYHEELPGGGDAPMLALYTFTGQRLGLAIDAAGHGDRDRDVTTRLIRIRRLSETSYAVYDPLNAVVRFIEVTDDGSSALEQRAVSIPFVTERVTLVAFTPREDGSIAFARTVADKGKPRTLITIVRSDGSQAEEWQAPETWQYGYADDATVYGFAHDGIARPLKIRAVDVR